MSKKVGKVGNSGYLISLTMQSAVVFTETMNGDTMQSAVVFTEAVNGDTMQSALVITGAVQ